jgi:tetratricopeptide (TPR) repeat protein
MKFGQENAEASLNLGISYYYLSKMLPSLAIGNGDTLSREDLAQRAIQHLEKSLSANADQPEAYFYLGESYQFLKEYPKALAAFQKYEEKMVAQGHEWSAKDAGFFESKGQILSEMGDSASLEGAILSLSKAIELDSTKTAAYSTLGKALYDKGEYERAIPFFKKRIEVDPDNVSANLNLAFCYLKQEKYRDAVEPLKKVVQLKPDNASAQDLLARVYLNLDNFNLAKDHYLKVLQLQPSQCDVQANVGYCYMRMNDPGAAVPYFRKTVSCFPRDLTHLLNLAQALELSKNTDEAYEYYLKVLEIDPQNKQALDGRDRIDMQRY